MLRFIVFALLCLIIVPTFAEIYSQGTCRDGKPIYTGFDDRGCPNPFVCVREGDCTPVDSNPVCTGRRRLVDLGFDELGCAKKSICVGPHDCPRIAPLPPDWCNDGQIVFLGLNERGCVKGVRCVRPGDCPVYRFP